MWQTSKDSHPLGKDGNHSGHDQFVIGNTTLNKAITEVSTLRVNNRAADEELKTGFVDLNAAISTFMNGCKNYSLVAPADNKFYNII